MSISQSLGSLPIVVAISSKIRNKLIAAFLVVALVPAIALAFTLYRNSADALIEQAFAQLDAVRTIKADQVSEYFQLVENQVVTFSENRMIVDAMREFPAAFKSARVENRVTADDIKQLEESLYAYYASDFTNSYRSRNNGTNPPLNNQFSLLDDDALYLQSLYISSNPNAQGSKAELDRADDQSRYTELHGKYHPVIRNYLTRFGFEDIFLCDLESGDIVYSVSKSIDLATSLKNGPYAKTNFARAFQQAASAKTTDASFLVDFEAYTASFEEPASFASSPIFDGDKKVGVLVFRIPAQRINEIMAERTGLGQTGETYAVGTDNLFRNDARFVNELGVATTMINPAVKVQTDPVRFAFDGKAGSAISRGYRGTTSLTSWTPVTIHESNSGGDEIRWALISELDLAEVRQPGMFQQMLIILAITAVGVAAVSLVVSRSLTRQADAISNMLSMIGIGDFDARAEILSNDELGQVAVSLNSMCDNTLSLIQSAEERAQIESAIESLRVELDEIASGNLAVEAKVGDDITGSIALAVNNTVKQLREIIQRVKSATLEVSSSAAQIQTATSHLSRGSEAQSTQIADTSTAITEMAASIQQVAKNTEDSAVVAQEARERARQGAQAVSATVEGMERIRNQVQETSKRIKRLGESSQEIGEIVQLISDIADRTSILALNASIQASMAGDAGQGFAVVAEEVERLAERSNEATKQIATLIKAIQTETAEAMSGMEESTREVVEGSSLAADAGQTLQDIDAVSTRLADLISTISLATKQQARGAEAVSKSMHEISEVTQQTAAGTSQAATSVSQLARLADDLRGSVSQFRLPAGQDVTESTVKPSVPVVTESTQGGVPLSPDMTMPLDFSSANR